jgi:AraC-like DNA-binding protein
MIGAIAYAAGFGDLSHFNRAFRRCYGGVRRTSVRRYEEVIATRSDMEMENEVAMARMAHWWSRQPLPARSRA